MNNQDQPSGLMDHNLDNIQVTSFHRQEPKSIMQENKFIKKQNQVLRRQLEKLSSRLDGQIRRRIDDSKRKHVNKGDEISQMELQNAYKKCQIYKKEAQMYRKKLENVGDQGRMEDFQRRVSSYARDNLELKEEIKQLKKISKLQEKGLTQLGIDGYTKLVGQNQKLKEEVRILKKQVDNYRRALQGTRQKRSHTSTFDDPINEPVEENRRASSKRGDSRIQSKLKRRIKTQHESGQSNEQINDLLQQKVERDYMKMKALVNQKNKLREMVDNLKFQLSQKEKETAMLKDKIGELRKNNSFLQSQVVASRPEPGSSQRKSRKDRDVASNYPKGIKSKNENRQKDPVTEPKRKPWKNEPPQPSHHQPNEFVQDFNHLPQSQESKLSSYPRSQLKQAESNNIIKWSHQHLSSKIRQIQLLCHEKGHIKDLHVRYDKGQPKKYDRSAQNQRYEIFSCCEDEYIKYVEGAFSNNYLQYLIITSNHRRIQKYGNYTQFETNKEAEHFEFEVKEGEYPGGLFGQSDESGIRKLGCFIHKEN